MKILITGAAGYLCQEAIRQLSEQGHTLRLSDVVEMETEHEFVKCDILDTDDLAAAVDGVDVVFHTVVGGRTKEPDTPAGRVRGRSKRFAVSVMGTFNVLQMAAEIGVPKVVIVGSEAARGQKLPLIDSEICDEETKPLPDGEYGLSKYIMEIIAEYAYRIDGVKTVVLRNAWFGSAAGKDLNRMGNKLLFQRCVIRKDLVRAAVLAIENDKLQHEVFMLCNSTEFTVDDIPELRKNPDAVIERYYPSTFELFKKYDIDPKPLHDDRKVLWKLDDSSKAERMLGWKPTYTYRDFYEELKAGKFTKDYIFYDE